MTDRVGQQLGHYRLLRLLGQGGFADAYLAEHLHLDTQVAVKVLSLRLSSDSVEQFRTEARTVARLVHPHIVRVLNFGVEDGTPYLVMDYAPGGTLRMLHPKGTRLPLETIVSYVKQVAEALQYAHERKLIHRDIKPENMLLGEHGQVVLSDFGIALVTQSTHYQHTQDVIGTAAYMAPEQLQGRPRRASDQYALGIVVYEWLCGDRPFHGTFTELYSQHLFVSPPSLSEKIQELPPVIENVVLVALAKDPERRFGSVQAFATALEDACKTTLPRPTAFSPEVPGSSQPSRRTQTHVPLPSNRGAPSTKSVPPPSQGAQPTVAAPPSLPLPEAHAATHREAPFSLPHGQRHEKTVAVPKPRRKTANISHRQGLPVRRTVLFIGLALLVLTGSLGLFFTMQQTALDSAHVAATAQARASTATEAAKASATADTEASSTAIAATATFIVGDATATAQANIAATAQANMTATAVASRNPDPSFATLILDDPLVDNSKGYGWDETKCTFSQGAYTASTSGGYSYCLATNTDFSDFVYQVQVKITKGDCGGIIFRLSGSSYDFFLICQDQSYALFMHNTNTALLSAAASGTSSALHRGLNQQNFIAVEAQGSTIKLYVNHQLLKSANDDITTHGQIGVIADDVHGHPTDVTWSNADGWVR